MDEEKIDFLAAHKEMASVVGFWDELSLQSVVRSIERAYKTDVIRNWKIDDLALKDNKILVKWQKRYVPLTDAELKDEYGRT